MDTSRLLAGLTSDQRKELQGRLHTRQSGHCYICDEPIALYFTKVNWMLITSTL